MSVNLFYILKGNNGATYICNTKNWATLKHSLKFYKARTAKTKFLKFGLQVLLFVKGKLGVQELKTSTAVETYIQTIVKNKAGFNIDTVCSILISPTQDKVIVNHHTNYFEKFAFGKSYTNVKKEANIYSLFNKSLENFQVSTYFDTVDKKDEMISFKLSNKHISTEKSHTNENLVPALLEFFKSAKQSKVSIKKYAENVQSELQQLKDVETAKQEQVLERIKRLNEELAFPLGLVHRDFKPWNVLNYAKPLIFDFEEAITSGLPLEDLLNYYIDPIIRYKTTEEVVKIALNETQLLSYKNYLKGLNIGIEFKVFLHFYLMERILFWSKANEMGTAIRYKQLSDYLMLQNKYS